MTLLPPCHRSYGTIKRSQLIQIIFLICAIIGYLNCSRRQSFSYSEFYSSFFLYIIATLFYFIKKKKKNYFDFDTLFILTSSLIGYLASFYYSSPFFGALFYFEFNYSYINSGTWLYTAGIIAYYCGGLCNKRIKNKMNYNTKPQKPYNNHIFFKLMVVFILLFVISGGISFYKSNYSGDSISIGLSDHFLVFAVIFSLILISIEFVNKLTFPNYKVHKLYFLVIFFFAIIVMTVGGTRTVAMWFILPIMGLYTFYFKPIKLKSFIILVIPAFIIMFIIQMTRADNDINFNMTSPVFMARDMTIPYRATFVAMEYVDKNGMSFGKSMTAPLIGTVPSLSRVMGADLRQLGSAELLTDYTYKTDASLSSDNKKVGLGTNTIADIYLSFGLLGTIILMYFLGWFVKMVENKAKSMNILWCITLAGLYANVIFLARSSYMVPIRYIVWGIVIYILYQSILYTKKKYNLSFRII